jgi:hypothetical protein
VSQPPLPNWVYDLVNAVNQYEHDHGSTKDGWPCLGKALAAVPDDVQAHAAVNRNYVDQQPEATPEQQTPKPIRVTLHMGPPPQQEPPIIQVRPYPGLEGWVQA